MSTPTPLPPEGWYPDPDPSGPGRLRWWTGATWSEYTYPAAPAPPAPQPGGPSAPTTGADPHAGTPTGGGYGYQADGGAHPVVVVPIGVWRSSVDDRPTVRGLGDAIRTVFGKYAQFDGRAGRGEFWFWALFNGIIVAGTMVLTSILSVLADASYTLSPVAALSGTLIAALWLWELAVVVPNLAVVVRRLRDGGFHWSLIFLSLIPFAGSIAVLVLCAQPTRHP